MDAERRELAAQVMRDIGVGEGDWEEVADPGSPAPMIEFLRGTIEAYRKGDIDWLLGQSDPQIEIVQPRELPDASSYRGHEGLVDALLDWPREWEDFSVEPTRIFAHNDHQYIVVATHRGRSLTMGIEIEAQIVWIFTRRDGLTTRWDMFSTLEQALEAAAQVEKDAE